MALREGVPSLFELGRLQCGAMSDDESLKQYAAKKGFEKLLDFLQAFISLKAIEKVAHARKSERLITQEAENEAKLKALEGDLAADKKKIDNKYALHAYEGQVKNNYLPEPRIPTVWAIGDYDIEIADIQPSLLKPLEQRRAFNILTVVSEAAKELPKHESISDENINPDVAIRIIENAKDVSDEYMQKLWGKLLAGEVAKPGKFSLRTLDVVKNLTSKEAQLFHSNLRFCNDDGVIYIPLKPLIPPEVGFRKGAMRILVECGLLFPDKEFAIGGFEGTDVRLPFRGATLHISSPPTRSHLTGIYFDVTEAGRQLANIGLPPVDEGYLRTFIALAETLGFKGEIIPWAKPTAEGEDESTGENVARHELVVDDAMRKT